jgi:hypothetical protein
MPVAGLASVTAAASAERAGTRRAIVTAVAVAALAMTGFALIRISGGSPTPLNHLGYAPILLAAYVYGLRGSLPAAVLVSVLFGPTAAWLGMPGGLEGPQAWLIRAVFFVGISVVGGGLFDQLRSHIAAWQTAAVTIAQRERDGMVALARGAEAKDTDTGDHIQRVRSLAEVLAESADMPTDEAEAIGWAAMLHDVGKLHIPDRILLKPAPLTSDEWELMRQHTVFGEAILSVGEGFETARRIARWHHENFDGSGYPDGLRREQIPLPARIVRVVDAFDAMTSDRPYHTARSAEWALAELQRHASTQFDPDLVALFVYLAETGRLPLRNDNRSSDFAYRASGATERY